MSGERRIRKNPDTAENRYSIYNSSDDVSAITEKMHIKARGRIRVTDSALHFLFFSLQQMNHFTSLRANAELITGIRKTLGIIPRV